MQMLPLANMTRVYPFKLSVLPSPPRGKSQVAFELVSLRCVFPYSVVYFKHAVDVALKMHCYAPLSLHCYAHSACIAMHPFSCIVMHTPPALLCTFSLALLCTFSLALLCTFPLHCYAPSHLHCHAPLLALFCTSILRCHALYLHCYAHLHTCVVTHFPLALFCTLLFRNTGDRKSTRLNSSH